MARATIKYKINHANGTTRFICFTINESTDDLVINDLTKKDIEMLVEDHFNSTVYYSDVQIHKALQSPNHESLSDNTDNT